MKRIFFDASLVTFAMFWLAVGPNLPEVTWYTILAFLCGLLAGISWGIFFLMWIFTERMSDGHILLP